MKKSTLVIAAILLIVQARSFGQISKDDSKTTIIRSTRLLVSTNKTTNLVFPFAIKSADRGSGDIIAQQVKGVENILQVKAGIKDFTETNLTVITADGKLYSFLVDYSTEPVELNIRFYSDTTKEESHIKNAVPESLASFSLENENLTDIQRTAEVIIKNRRKTVRGVKDKKYEILLRLLRVDVKENALYYKVQIKNSSNINYDVDMIRFFIRDKKQAKRSATQELEVTPLYVAGGATQVKAHSNKLVVFAFEKFTIPEAKYFACEVKEKNGGRNLSFKVNNGHIIHARMISSSK